RDLIVTGVQTCALPISECGASVEHSEVGAHVCERERLLDYRLFQLREEIGAFDAQLAAWRASARGRFAAWVAERERRARGEPGPDRKSTRLNSSHDQIS